MPPPPGATYILPTLSPLQRLYYTYLSQRLPWRNRFFIGHDLSGNTYWELRHRIHHSRPRRMIEFTGPGSEREKMSRSVPSVQWHQWLRGMRVEPPSVQELMGDVLRIGEVRRRAGEIEERWRVRRAEVAAGEGGRKLEGGAGALGGRLGEGGGVVREGGEIVPEEGGKEGEKQAGGGGAPETTTTPKAKEEDPWEKARRQQESEQQESPGGWTPRAAGRR